MKKRLVVLVISSIIYSALSLAWFFWPQGRIKGDGIYIGYSGICSDDNCKLFKDILPKEFLLVPPADDLYLCDDIVKGWCAEIRGTATSTLKGFFPLKVRTFWRKDIKSKKIYENL